MTWKYKALLHAKREDPKESCGLLLNIKGKERYYPCRNLSMTEHQCFIIDPEDYVKADNTGEIVWAGNSYQRFPIEATGFAYQRGQIPRPKLVVSNALGTISAILLLVNQTTAGNDLTGATFTRIRTMARFLDAANFSGGTNPLGTPDPTAEFKRQIYTIDRKAAENREVVEFELAGAIDMAGVRAPKRQCTRALFPSIGTFTQ